jgi:hypothetical protein
MSPSISLLVPERAEVAMIDGTCEGTMTWSSSKGQHMLKFVNQTTYGAMVQPLLPTAARQQRQGRVHTWFVWMCTFITNPTGLYAWHCMNCDAGHV